MADPRAQPTFNDMLQWRDRLGGEWLAGSAYGTYTDRGMDDAMQDEENLYFQRFEVESPGGRLKAKTGSAPSDADAAIDTLVPPEVQVKVRPARDRAKYRDQAEKLQKAGAGLLHAWRRQKDVIRLIASDMVIRRVGVGRVLVDNRLWPDAPLDLSTVENADGVSPLMDWEVKHRRKCPIVLERRNPRYVRWRQTDDGEILVVVERYRTTVLEAAVTFGRYEHALRVLNRLEPNDMVDISDVWYGGYRCQMINDEPIYPGDRRNKLAGVLPHIYDEIPYIIMPFRELGFEEPSLRYRGMLTNAAGLYTIESSVLTMQIWMLAWNAWRTWIGWTVPGRSIEVIPGQYIPIDKRRGEYIEMMEGRPVPPELLQTAAVIDSYIQRNGVAQGPRNQEGTRSAQQVWAIQSIRQMKVESAKQSLQGGLERALQLATMMIEKNLRGGRLTLPVPGKDRDGRFMGEVTVGPGDVDGYWDGFTVNFGRRLDPALLEQAKALMALSTNNWMPLKESWELSGLTDSPDEWENALLRQAMDRLDFMLEAAGLVELKDFFGEDSDEYKLFASRIAQARRGQQQGAQLGGGPQPTALRGPTPAPQGGGPLAAGNAPSRSNSRATGNTTGGGGAPNGAMPGGGM